MSPRFEQRVDDLDEALHALGDGVVEYVETACESFVERPARKIGASDRAGSWSMISVQLGSSSTAGWGSSSLVSTAVGAVSSGLIAVSAAICSSSRCWLSSLVAASAPGCWFCSRSDELFMMRETAG